MITKKTASLNVEHVEDKLTKAVSPGVKHPEEKLANAKLFKSFWKEIRANVEAMDTVLIASKVIDAGAGEKEAEIPRVASFQDAKGQMHEAPVNTPLTREEVKFLKSIHIRNLIQIGPNQYKGQMLIKSTDLAEEQLRGVFTDYDRETCPYQRRMHNNNVSRAIHQCYVTYLNALSSGMSMNEASSFLPKGDWILSLNRRQDDTFYFCLINGAHRARILAQVAKEVGTEIEVLMPITLYVHTTENQEADLFLKYNYQTATSPSERINANLSSASIRPFAERVTNAFDAGLFTISEENHIASGHEHAKTELVFVPNEIEAKRIHDEKSSREPVLAKDFARRLIWGIYRRHGTDFVMQTLNDVHQDAINSFGRVYTLFRHIVGEAGIEVPRHNNYLKIYSGRPFQDFLAELSIVYPLEIVAKESEYISFLQQLTDPNNKYGSVFRSMLEQIPSTGSTASVAFWDAISDNPRLRGVKFSPDAGRGRQSTWYLQNKEWNDYWKTYMTYSGRDKLQGQKAPKRPAWHHK